jgi:peptide deformylase
MPGSEAVALLPLRFFGDPVLRQRARPVERVTDEHLALVRNLTETMRDAPGVGLAAPQVGVLERVFSWEVEDRSGAFINPVIEERSDELEEAEEGCLSVPGLYYPVLRSTAVRVSGLDGRGEPVVLEAEGLLARVFQHETDHLDGVLFIDHLPAELRREALATLRERMLGLAGTPPAGRASL